MNYNIDTQKALTKWGLVLENMGIKDQDKKEWVSEYAEYHLMNENLAYSQLGAPAGMGNIVPATVGSTPGALWGDGAGTKGSGDIAQSLLPVSMQIAKQAIGLDLVAVKPASSPYVTVAFLDWKYDDVNPNSGIQQMIFKITSVTAAFKSVIDAAVVAAGATLSIGGVDKPVYLMITGGTTATDTTTAPTIKTGVVEFLGYSSYGYNEAMFRSYRQTNTAVTGTNYGFDAELNTFPQGVTVASEMAKGLSFRIGAATGATGAIEITTIEPISTLEDHLPGFSRGWSQNSMSREVAENTYPGIVGANLFTLSFKCGEINESGALLRTEIEDIKSSTGIDIVQKMEAQLVNNLTQTISKEIVSKMKSLAIKNRSSNSFVASTYDFDLDTYFGTSGNGAAPGGETTHAAQRKLVTKVIHASEFIRLEGRIGGATYIVTNIKMATVLKDISGYTINPVDTKINSNGQMYPMGTVSGIQIYVDPYQALNDNRIFLGRKNSVDQPGLLFVPYLMAQAISLIPEGTFGIRTQLRSRYSIVDTGWYPEKQFICINVKDTYGYLS